MPSPKKLIEAFIDLIEEGAVGNTRPIVVQRQPDIDSLKSAMKYGTVRTFKDPKGGTYAFSQYADEDPIDIEAIMKYYELEPKDVQFKRDFFMKDGTMTSDGDKPALYEMKKFIGLVE